MKELKLSELPISDGVSFSGTRFLTSKSREVARSLFFSHLNWLSSFDTAFFGAAKGIDTLTGEWCNEFNLPIKKYIVIVPANQSKVDWSFKDWATHVFYMPEGTDYKNRNQVLVAAGRETCAFPDYDEERGYRSGTWMAIRIARELRRNVMINILTGGHVLWEQNS